MQPQQESILKQQCLEASAPVLEPEGDMEVVDGGQVGLTVVDETVERSHYQAPGLLEAAC
jgi:hypothetical protein